MSKSFLIWWDGQESLLRLWYALLLRAHGTNAKLSRSSANPLWSLNSTATWSRMSVRRTVSCRSRANMQNTAGYFLRSKWLGNHMRTNHWICELSGPTRSLAGTITMMIEPIRWTISWISMRIRAGRLSTSISFAIPGSESSVTSRSLWETRTAWRTGSSITCGVLQPIRKIGTRKTYHKVGLLHDNSQDLWSYNSLKSKLRMRVNWSRAMELDLMEATLTKKNWARMMTTFQLQISSLSLRTKRQSNGSREPSSTTQALSGAITVPSI